jgi:hypothetical protein
MARFAFHVMLKAIDYVLPTLDRYFLSEELDKTVYPLHALLMAQRYHFGDYWKRIHFTDSLISPVDDKCR